MPEGLRLLAIVTQTNRASYNEALEQGDVPASAHVIRGKNDQGNLKTVHADTFIAISRDEDPEDFARQGDAYVVLDEATVLSSKALDGVRELTDAAVVFAQRNADELGAVGKTYEEVATTFAEGATLPLQVRPEYSR